MTKQVFISHSSKDGKIAGSICSALEARGHRCWMSSRDVRPGENFQGAIVRAIREARVMVMIFSTNANNSEEIKKEMALASQSHLMVIPVRAEDVLPSEDFTYELATRQWIDMFNDWEQAIEQLGAQIDLAVPREDGAAPAASPASNSKSPKPGRLPLFAGIIVLLMAAGAGAFWLTRPSPPPPKAAPAAPQLAQQQPAPVVAAIDPAKLESDLWDSVKDSGDAAALKSYLAKYPNGMFAAAARAKLAALNKPAPVKTQKVSAPPPPVSEAVAPTPQPIPASEPKPVSSPGLTLNPQVQQAVDMARQTEKRARAVAEKAETMAGQGQPGKPRPGFPGLLGRPHMGGLRSAGLDIIAFPGGDRYAGGTRDGRAFGLGVLTGAPNHIYRERIGQFASDLLFGYGVVHRRDGNVRIGQWKNGLMNGYGAYLGANGRILEQGVYANDKLATPLKGN